MGTQQTNSDISEWLTPSDCAERLKLSRSTMYELIRTGALPHSRLSARVIRLHWPTVEQAMLEKQQGGKRGGAR
jgi:excisionase family DNA binding protein